MQHPTYSPKAIEALISKSIVGQDNGVRVVSTAFAAHLLRIEHNRQHPETPLRKDNLLVIGPTGSGKTESIMTAIRECDLPIPVAVISANTLTPSGYKGKSVETILEDLFQDACRIIDQDPEHYYEDCLDEEELDCRKAAAAVELAGKGIIILDEVDKLRIHPEDRQEDSLFPRCIQHQLLKIIEGGTGFGGKEHVNQIDTTDILFILSGAFVGLDDVTRKRLDPAAAPAKNIGFLAGAASADSSQPATVAEATGERTSEELIPTTEDLVAYGYIPELMGRVTLRCRYSPITVDILYRILQESSLSPAKESERFFAETQNSLEFTNNALMEIARQAVKLQSGVRGLRTRIADITYPLYYELSGKTGQRIVITQKVARGEASPLIRPGAKKGGKTAETQR